AAPPTVREAASRRNVARTPVSWNALEGLGSHRARNVSSSQTVLRLIRPGTRSLTVTGAMVKPGAWNFRKSATNHAGLAAGPTALTGATSSRRRPRSMTRQQPGSIRRVPPLTVVPDIATGVTRLLT